MKKIIKDNLKKITALLLVISMTMSLNISPLAQEDITKDITTEENDINDIIVQDDIVSDEAIVEDNTLCDETEVEVINKLIEEDIIEEDTIEDENSDITETALSVSISSDAEKARERECMPASDIYLKKFLTYLSLKYPEIGIDTKFGASGGDKTQDPYDDLYNLYNATKMARQTVYDTIEINGEDTFEGYPNLTDNMVQFKFLGNFGGQIGTDYYANQIYSDTVKTLIIRNVDEIRNLNIPASVENLVIENTTLNCYQYEDDSPGFQRGLLPGNLKYCTNLKSLIIKNVKFGDNYKKGDEANLLPEITYNCPYETNYVLNLQNCPNLEELVIDVSFDGAEEVQLAIDGGTDNYFENLKDDKCTINPEPGTDSNQIKLYVNKDSYLAKRYNSSVPVEFENKLFRSWLLEAIGIDTNHDGVISQAEMDAIENLTINDETAHYASQTSLSAFHELTDIAQMHGLKTLNIDFYDQNSYSDAERNNRHPLEGIDFPESLENLTMENIYWEKNTQTKSHDNADIELTNLKTLRLYNTKVKVGADDSYFAHSSQIRLTDTEGVLQSCIIESTDVESIKLINNSNGKGIKDSDEKQRIRFSASDCPNLKSIEFLGEGYAVEGSLDIENDTALTHIGVPNEDRTQWTVYGEFDSTYAPTNVVINSCSSLGSDCNEVVIDYNFINGRDLNVQAMDTDFSDAHELTICRKPRIQEDRAGNVYLSCDSTGSNVWVYNKYKDEEGFVIESRSSFPTIAVFANGQRIRTSGEGNHNSDSKYTEDSDRWVERWNLVMSPGGYSNAFGSLTFYVVDKVVDGAGNTTESLRRVFYNEPVYVEWNQQNDEDKIITLPTEEVGDRYKLTGTKLSSTGTPGEVELKLYVLKEEDGSTVKSYIGYQNIKVFAMPDSVELVSDGTMHGSGTKDDPFIIDKKSNEELKLKARLKVNGEVDSSGDYALRNVIWRIKEYDEVPKYTSDSDGYSLYTLDSATKAGISVVRGELNPGEDETKYDERIDSFDGSYYSHRRLAFNTDGTKYKIVAQSPYKNYEINKSGAVISSEVYVEISDKPITIDISNDNRLIHGKNGWDETTITINNVDNSDIVDVSIKDQELYDNCFIVARDSSSTDSKEVWKLKVNSSDNSKIKNIINNNNSIILVIKIDDKKIERIISLSSVFPDTETFWCSEIEDQTYTGKAIKPKLNIYNGKLRLVEGKDYTLSYGNNTNAVSKNAIDKRGKRIGPYITINGKGNYANKQTYYFSIVPRSIENTAKVDDIIAAKTGKDIKITPIVTLDGKKLKQGTDFVVSTTEDENDAIVSRKDPQDYTLYVVGKGNYTGAIPFSFIITESILASKVTIQKIANQNYNDGDEIKPDIKITYNRKDVTDCFNIKYENNIEIGIATVVVTSKKTSEGKDFIGEAGYSFRRIKKTTFKINGLKITDTKLGINGKDKMPEFIYSGKRHKPKINLYYKTGIEPLEEGKDYTITYSNNINAGNAMVLITGMGKYTGTKTLKFKINKYDAGSDTDNVISINNAEDLSVSYEKGGVAPKPTISMNGVVLTEKKDYTVNYTNNKAVAKSDAVNSRGKSIAPTIVVTFKGNFSGKKSVAFTITAKDIAIGKVTLADKPISTKKDAWKQTAATIVDTNGKKLAAGTDYNKYFEYYCNPDCTKVVTDEIIANTFQANEDNVEPTEKLTDNTVYVKVTGIKNYEGSYIVGSYRISNNNIYKVAATIADQIYTGEEICPSANEIIVTVGSKNNKKQLTAGVDYEVVAGSYRNNTNKGTASVTICGIGDYYGTKVVKYKIAVNRISWWNWLY